MTDNNRLLVTMDGHLPVLPVDDGTSYRPSQSVGDILWFMKVIIRHQIEHSKCPFSLVVVISCSAIVYFL